MQAAGQDPFHIKKARFVVGGGYAAAFDGHRQRRQRAVGSGHRPLP